MKIRMGWAITGWLVAGAMAVAQTPVNVGSSVVTMSLDGFVGGFPSGLNQALKGQPYSLLETTTTVRTLADGTTIRSKHEERKMRDSEGRTRMDLLHEFKGETTITMATISDPVTRTRTTLNVRQKMAYTFHLPELKPAPRPPVDEKKLEELRAAAKSRSTPNFQTEKLGGKNVSGIFAEGTRTTRLIPAGMEGNDREIRVVIEQWVSPDLKITVARSIEDPRFGLSTMEVSDLLRGDPDAALFQVPADYKMVAQPSVTAVQ
jgi:hypothetical protein